MGGCWSSSSERSASTPTYLAILSDMYQLIPYEEQQLIFTKKADLMKYYDDFSVKSWPAVNTHFKQHVKTLIDHVEAYKIRLLDSSLYIENKIKLTHNPIVLKMSTIILLELVQNLNKFVLQKEIMMTQNNREEASQILERLDSGRQDVQQMQGPQTITYISDNFLRFELIFSAIVALLINSKQLYNMLSHHHVLSRIWIESVMQALQSFASEPNRHYQSENIYKIVDFLDQIVGFYLTGSFDLLQCIYHFIRRDPMFVGEDQKAFMEMIQGFSETQNLTYFKTYLDTLTMIIDQLIFQQQITNATSHTNQLFNSKNQKTLFKQILTTQQISDVYLTIQDNQATELSTLCLRFVVIISKRAFVLKTYDELFQAIFQNYDPEFWKSSPTIEKLTDIQLLVAKKEGFLQNIEIFFLSRFLEFIQNQVQQEQQHSKKVMSEIAQLQPLTFKQKSQSQLLPLKDLQHSINVTSPRNHYTEPSSNINKTVIKQIGYMLSKFESSQFLLFSLENIIKTVINNLRQHNEDDPLFQESNNTLAILVEAIVPDLSAYITYLNMIVSSSYAQYLLLSSGKMSNESFLDQLLVILKNCVQKVQNMRILNKKAVMFKQTIFIKDDQLFPIVQFAEYNPTYGVPVLRDLLFLQLPQQELLNSVLPMNTNVFQFSTSTFMLISNKIIKHVLDHPNLNLNYGIEVIQQTKDPNLLVSLCLKIVYGDRYSQLQVDRNIAPFFETKVNLGLFLRGVVTIKQKRISVELSQWAYSLLMTIDSSMKSSRVPDDYLDLLETLHHKIETKSLNLQVLISYLDQNEWIDFDELDFTQKLFIETLNNLNEEIVDIDEIQIYDNEKRGSMFQSVVLASNLDLQLDQSFEKVLHTIKKHKQKQGKFDQITAQDQNLFI